MGFSAGIVTLHSGDMTFPGIIAACILHDAARTLRLGDYPSLCEPRVRAIQQKVVSQHLDSRYTSL